MRIIYAGTPEFAVPALAALLDSRHQVVAVYTQPDRPAGRGRHLQASPVKTLALQQDVPLQQPESLKDPAAQQVLRSYAADLMVVAAYGLILPAAVLEAPALGCVNIHASLLPRWRGAAPIQRGILAGDRQTGVTLMQMDAGLDTGDMLAVSRIALDERMSAADLHDELKILGANLLMQNLDAIEHGGLAAVRQDDSQACYAAKLTRQEAAIDWHKPAQQLEREIRAFNPWPVSYSTLQGKNVKIWSAVCSPDNSDQTPGRVLAHDRDGIRVSCGSGILVIDELQFAGKKRTRADQVLNSLDLSHEILGR